MSCTLGMGGDSEPVQMMLQSTITSVWGVLPPAATRSSWTWTMWKYLMESAPARVYSSLTLTLVRSMCCSTRGTEFTSWGSSNMSQTLVLWYTRSVWLRYERNQICTLSSTFDWLPSGSTQHVCEWEFGSILSLTRLIFSPCFRTLTPGCTSRFRVLKKNREHSAACPWFEFPRLRLGRQAGNCLSRCRWWDCSWCHLKTLPLCFKFRHKALTDRGKFRQW